jgi:LysM repeat protein
MRGILLIALVAAVMACAEPASAAARPWTGHYTVRAGDSLTAIAKRYAVSFHTLAEVNGLDWRRPLWIGVVLRVPATRHATAHATTVYVVRVGDTLSGIALRYHVSLARLASANRIDLAGVLLAGARLRIPGATGASFSLAHIVESDPYRSGSVGYDFSYPNCATRVPASPTFAVIGLNLGRPFTANPCFALEWNAARRPRSVYVNTAYSRVLFRHITPACSAAGSRQRLAPAAQRAYAVGCSEAEEDIALLAATPPLAIWLDVEPGNTWSARRSLNAATIKGMLERLLGESGHPAVGVYSNAAFWRGIVGRWSSLSIPEWVATGAPDPPGCPAGFAAGPVWLSQSTDGRVDTDTAC